MDTEHTRGHIMTRAEIEAILAGTNRKGIYIASKVKHAHRWQFLRDVVGEPVISTWIDEAGEGQSSDLADLWQRCIAEASSARVLILYREPDEVLKGGWVELGAALASGVTVIAVGIEEFTVAHDKRIIPAEDMKHAIELARTMYLAPDDRPQTVSALCTALIESMDRVEELEGALKEFDRYSLVIESAVRTCDPIRRPEVLAALRAARKSLGGSNER